MGTFRNPARKSLMALSTEMQRMLDEFLACKNPMNIVLHPIWRPATDVLETESHIVVKIDIAGMKEKDITVTFHPKMFHLRISGRRVEECSGRKIACSQMEIVYGAFQRHIELPRGIDANGITRSYKDGFLEILIPKETSARVRKVPIKVRE